MATVALNLALNFLLVRFMIIDFLKYTNLTNGPGFGEYYTCCNELSVLNTVVQSIQGLMNRNIPISMMLILPMVK